MSASKSYRLQWLIPLIGIVILVLALGIPSVYSKVQHDREVDRNSCRMASSIANDLFGNDEEDC